MKNNASLREIGKMLDDAGSVMIFPHINPDGDALGSAIALCLHLRGEGKDAVVIMEDEFPHYVDFLDTDCCSCDAGVIASPDVSVSVDCSETKRFPANAGVYSGSRIKISIDHHEVTDPAGEYYYIDSEESAAAQIIYKLFREMQWTVDDDIAKHLYTGIVTDTGCFQYSNTSAETHSIAADLMRYDIPHNDIMVRLYQNISRKRVEIQGRILETMEIFSGGTAAVAYVTGDMLRSVQAELDDTEGMVDILRNIEGVEIAAFLKEKQGAVRVSMRAKSSGDVNSIARTFGGGGHIKAAGCTLDMSMPEALQAVKYEIEKSLGNTAG